MRDSISALVIVTAIALAGCTAGNQRTDGIETLPSVPEERYTPAATSSFPGEAAHLINKTSNAPVAIWTEPSVQARSIGQVQGGEVLTISRSVEGPELDNRKSTWLQIDRGWISAEFRKMTASIDISQLQKDR